MAELNEAERTELLDWVSSCQSSYHIDSTPGHRFGGLGSHLQENRDALVEYVNELLAARAQPAQEVPRLSDEEIEQGRHATFSTNNPYCPCDSKTMRKAARWAESALLKKMQGPTT